MQLLFSFVIFFLVTNVNSQEDRGDEPDPDFITDGLKFDSSNSDLNFDRLTHSENLYADQADVAKSMNPEIFLADLGPDEVDSPGTKDPAALDSTIDNSLDRFRVPEYPVFSPANSIYGQFDTDILDEEKCTPGYKAVKVAMPGEVQTNEEAPGVGRGEREGQYRYCKRNPAFLTERGERRNCPISKDTFCGWGPVSLPYVDNCLAYHDLTGGLVREVNIADPPDSRRDYIKDICQSFSRIFCCSTITFNPRLGMRKGLGKCAQCKHLFEAA
ncbi:hypothetical protein MMC07_005370 [Pseudocyphellaria aurata]|nr:hypothetical protein [Pseudocyphellaria aurata]